MGFFYGCKWKKAILLLLFTAFFALLPSGCGGKASEAVIIDSGENVVEDKFGVDYIYGIPIDENAAVVTESIADLYERPDVTSARLTQVLCNQPVGIISNEGGWARVKTISGITGWIRSKLVSSDISSISGRVYTYRIVVTSREKTVYSSPDGGITMVNAQMGTEFYAFNNVDDAYEVFLPGNRTGWLKGSGIIRVPVNDAIPVTNADDFASTALKFKGTSFMLNGISSMGIDAPGLVYISARINGVDVPATIEGQLAAGIQIDIDEAQAGDIVFLRGTGDNDKDKISCVGICIGGGSYIYAGRRTGCVAVGDIYRENQDGMTASARRIFN